MGHSICIVPARTGGHDWSVIADNGNVAAQGHEDGLLQARKASWKAFPAAGEDRATESPDVTSDARNQMLQPAPDFGIPCHSLRWLGATQVPAPRNAS